MLKSVDVSGRFSRSTGFALGIAGVAGALTLADAGPANAEDCGTITADTTISTAVNGTCVITAPAILTFDENGSVTNVDDLNAVTSEDGVEVRNSDIEFSIVNRGTIEGYAPIYIDNATGGQAIDNYGLVRSTLSANNSETSGIVFTNPTVFGRLTNHETGTIQGHTAGINLVSGAYVDEIYNYGLIAGSTDVSWGGGYGMQIGFNGNVGTLVNLGVIQGENTDTGDHIDLVINKYGVSGLSLFENAQRGADLYSGNDRLVLSGELPASYNIIINSDAEYGQLNVVEVGGVTTFGVSALSQSFSAMSFEAVMTGVEAANFSSLSGTYLGADWDLSEQGSSTGIWDLTFQSRPLFDTAESLEMLTESTVGAMRYLDSAVTSALDARCSTFGDNNLCVRAAGRITSVVDGDGPEGGTASLVAAYRFADTLRVGGLLDQEVGGVSGQGYDYDAAMPTLGAFVEHGREDRSGLQMRLAASVGAGDLSTIRGVSLDDAEAGMGEADMHGWGVLGRVGFGYSAAGGVMVTPYLGVRHVDIERDAYQEMAGPDVAYPFRYDAYGIDATTGIVGAKLGGKLRRGVFFEAEFGLERDLDRNDGAFTGSSDMLEFADFSYDLDGMANETRLFGGASLSFELDETTRLGLGVMAREMTYGDGTEISTNASLTMGF